jgi:hypothetical protein
MAGDMSRTLISGVTFVGLRMRLENRPGHRPVPVELAAMARHGDRDGPASWRVHTPIVPPEPAAVPPPAPSVPVAPPEPGTLAAAFADVERRLVRDTPHALVVVNGFVEKAVVWEQRAHCPRLASCVLLDVLGLAAAIRPAATRLPFEARLQQVGVSVPAGERALTWDVYAAMTLFRHVVGTGASTGRWSTLDDLIRIAGTVPDPVEPEFMPVPDVQESLFD